MPVTEEAVYELPKWVKILFRFYAVIFLLGTIVVGVKLVHSVTTWGQELLTIATDSLVSTSGIIAIALFAFALVILALEVLYGIGAYKFKRWVLPLVLTFSFSTILIGLLNIFNLNFAGIADLVSLLIDMTFMGLVGFAGIKYWNVFTGPARKLLIQIPLLLVFLPFIVFATLSQIYTDDPQINDTDLVLQSIEVLPEFDNAYYSLPNIDDLSAQQQLSYKSALAVAKEIDGKDFNNPEAVSLLNQTRGLTNDFIAASNKKGYQCPTLVNNYGIDAVICSLNDIRDLAILTSFRAAVEVDTGNPDQAIDTSVSIVRAGDLISNAEQSELIEYLVGVALMNIGLESIERTLNNSTSTSNQVIESAISELEQSKIDTDTFSGSLRREYTSMKDMSKSFEQFSNYFYQHNKTVNERAELFRKQISMSSLGCNADTTRQQQEIEQLVTEIRLAPTKWPVISPNFIGKVLNSVVVASLNTSGQKGCEVNDLNLSMRGKMEQKMAEQFIGDFLGDRKDFFKEAAEEFKQENPESELDVEAILKQVSDLALITSALRAYSIDSGGTYPSTLNGLMPKYTPEMMFPKGQIPLDYNKVPFDYTASPDRTSYTLCSQDLEEGGTDCIESNS